MKMVHNSVHAQLIAVLVVKIPTHWVKIYVKTTSYPNLERVGHNIDS